MDIDLNDVLQDWFGEERADENGVTDIDAFLYDAMFPEDVDFDIANQTEEEETANAFDQDLDLGKLFDDSDHDVINELAALGQNQEANSALDNVDTFDGVELYPCSECSLEFISLENLQSHEARCKSKNFRFRCIHCNRKFTRALYKDLHQQNCDRNVDEQACSSKQTTLDEFYPPSPKRLRAVQVGGSAVEEHGETWAMPKMIESALSKSAVTYRKEFDQANKDDLFARCEKVLSTLKSVLIIELLDKKGVKFYFTIRAIFHQSKDPSIITEPPVSFRSEVFTALNTDKFNLHLKVAMMQFQKQLEEFERNGSGWVLNHFVNMDIGKNLALIEFLSFRY